MKASHLSRSLPLVLLALAALSSSIYLGCASTEEDSAGTADEVRGGGYNGYGYSGHGYNGYGYGGYDNGM